MIRLIVLGHSSDDKGTQLETLTASILSSLKYTDIIMNVVGKGGNESDVGCETFINVIYPELKRDINVDVQYLSAKYKTYAEYTLKSQKSRLSKGKSIFRNEEVCDALMFIINSSKVSSELKYKAKMYLEQEQSI